MAKSFFGSKWVFAAVMVVLIAGCAKEEDDVFKKKPEALPEEEDKFGFLKHGKLPAVEKDKRPEKVELGEVAGTHAEFESMLKADGQDKMGEKDTAPVSPELKNKPVPRFYEDMILLNADEKVKVSVAFNSAPLIDVLPVFADILGFDFIADSELKGVVSVNFNSNMTRRELWEALDHMLYLAGAGAVKSGYVVRVMPLSKMPAQTDIRAVSRGDGTGEILYYALKSNAVNEVVNQLKPFLGQNSLIVPLLRQNALLISDHSANIPKLKQLLDIADQEVKSARSRSLIYCSNILPTKLIAELATIMPVLGFPVVAGGSAADQPGAIQLSGIDRLQVVLATAANEEAIQEVKRWVAILDKSMKDEREQVFIYKVSSGRADHLTQALSSIFNVSANNLQVTVTSTGITQTQVQQITSQQRQQQTPSSNTLAGMSNAMANTTVDMNSNVFESPVKLFADGVNNRLVIRTTSRVYAVMRAVLERLDVVPSQVLLQVMVMEVTLNDTTKFGLEYSYQTGSGSLGSLSSLSYNPVTLDSSGNPIVPPATVPGEGGGFSIFNPNNPNEKFAKITALAGNNNVKVIASPQILVTSNTEAFINVGKDIPTLTQSTSTIINPDATSNYIKYEPTGVTLTVTPQVTSTDLITLDLKQEISTAGKNTTSDINSPQFDKRTLRTTMTIGNGKTMIIGGIIHEDIQDNLSTIPFLGNIPFIRRLIGQTDYKANRIELLVMITGYIVNEKSPLEDMVRRYNEAIKAVNASEARIEKNHQDDLKKAQEYRDKKRKDAAINPEKSKTASKDGKEVKQNAAVTGQKEEAVNPEKK